MSQANNASWHNPRMRLFHRKDRPLANTPQTTVIDPEKGDSTTEQEPADRVRVNARGQQVNHAGHEVAKGIQPDGESGRKGLDPLHFLRICFRSSCAASKWTNILWPFAIAALVLRYGYKELDLWIFITAYIGIVPAANLLGFAGQELARKLPKVIGIILETTLGSIVEIILFMVLLKQGQGGTETAHNHASVIRAAILGSILANVLFCLGLCFFVGGIFHPQQTFHEAISEVGSNLMLVATVGLVIPTIFVTGLNLSALNTILSSSTAAGLNSASVPFPAALINANSLRISRATAIILLVAFLLYVWFQARSHHGLYEDILEADEMRDHDRQKDLYKPKLTLTEAVIAVVIALTFVTLMAIFLVEKIEYMVTERGINDAFMGLILVPIVEKAAEHITAVDEAYDNQMNFALAHVLGASIQTALLNTPLVILVAWGIGDDSMSLNFEIFDAVVLVLAIIVVGNFLRDEKSDYLEGALCVFVWILIAVCAFYYPALLLEAKSSETGDSQNSSVSGETAVHAVHQVVKLMS